MFAVMRDDDIIKDDRLYSHDRNLVAVFNNSTMAWDYIKRIPCVDNKDDYFDCKVKSNKLTPYDRPIEVLKTSVSEETIGVHNVRITYFVQEVSENPEA